MATVQIAEKLLPILTKPKRLKIAVGGRGGSKSIGFADAFLKKCDDGERLCCGREFQNSIDDSVHSLLTARVDALDIADHYSISAKDITSRSGGKIFYKGLARNPESIKSMQGVNTLWIEEAQTLSEKTIEVLFPTIRETDSEIWCSLNRGSSKDPFARRFLKPYEDHLKRHGYYEDDETLIVEINWQDNPWFPTVLQGERLRDKKNLPPARYEHIWEGAYSDTVDNAIIEPEWFDACIDAHIKLGFKPEGIEVVSHDAFDGGQDPAALAYRHGSVILDVQESSVGRANDGCDWAIDYALKVNADAFTWDGDGVGAGLKRQIDLALGPKNINIQMFNGGTSPDRPDAIYEPSDGEIRKAKTNRETFYNRRAQAAWMVRDRMFKTYLAVRDGSYINPDELISISSTIKGLPVLRAEACRLPKKDNGSGKIQLMSKPEMKKLGIDSPNMFDALMMNIAYVPVRRKKVRTPQKRAVNYYK